MALPKINDLARVTYIGQLDHPHPGRHVQLVLLGSGDTVSWRMSTETEWVVDDIAPFRVGDELALDATHKHGALHTVRYACKGKQFRGAAWHRTHRVA